MLLDLGSIIEGPQPVRRAHKTHLGREVSRSSGKSEAAEREMCCSICERVGAVWAEPGVLCCAAAAAAAAAAARRRPTGGVLGVLKRGVLKAGCAEGGVLKGGC